jgi:hypothetical protein
MLPPAVEGEVSAFTERHAEDPEMEDFLVRWRSAASRKSTGRLTELCLLRLMDSLIIGLNAEACMFHERLQIL